MAKPKFTPGPWKILPEECDKPYIRVRGTVLGARYKVANVVTPVYEGVHEREAVETRANANLIASAPDLYDALDGVRQWLELGDYEDSFMAPIISALKKARGQV